MTKKEIREFLGSIKKEGFYGMGAYSIDGKVFLYADYTGSMAEVVYNESYDEHINFTDNITSWFNGEFNKENIVNFIYEKVKEIEGEFLKAEMSFHNLSERTTHSIYEIIEYNTGIEAKCIGYNRGKKVYDLEGKLYKLIQFDVFNNESWVTLKEYKGKTQPKFYNFDQEEKVKNDEYTFKEQGSIDHFKW